MARRQKQPRTAAVTDLADEGYGLTEDQRFAVYGLLPGETATILPRKKKKGVWLSLHENRQGEHPDRVTPACAHADVCGGCAFQHLAHERQIEFKEARLKRLFEPLQPLTWMPPAGWFSLRVSLEGEIGREVCHQARRGAGRF